MPGYRNYGPNVSQSPQDTSVGGQFSGDEKSYESVVIQDDAPVIDWEMNLRADVRGDFGLRQYAQRSRPSSFLDGDFLERPDLTGSFQFLSPVVGNENKFRMLAANVRMNGWDLRVEYTGTSTPGLNEVSLTSPPASGGRTDLVILEAWRALVRATPSVANKSPTGLILRNGNVKAPDAVNLTDDLIDPTYGLESSARVQIQYRLRTIPGVDLASFPDGLEDPAVVAHTVSDFSGPGADGSATAYAFSNVADDRSLWRAGTGDSASATALGTVDGYMYAIPVCAVFRRNTTAFSRTSNLNGGSVISSGTSTRPDGLFADQVIADDVRDLRKGVAGSPEEVLEKAFQQVLDNSLSSQAEASAVGTSGTAFLYRDDIGLSGHIGNPDEVRRYFSDRSVTETIVVEVAIGGLPASGISINLSSLKLPWNGFSTPFGLLAPTGVSITAVNAVRIVDTAGSTDRDMFNATSPIRVANMQLSIAPGPGVDQLNINFNTTAANVSIYVELAITYPPGVGMSRNVLSAHQLWSPSSGLPAWVDATGWAATSDASRSSVPSSPSWWISRGHRELAFRLKTTSQVRTFYTFDTDKLLIWERLTGDPIDISDGINPVYSTTNYTFNTAYTLVQLTGGTPVPAGTAVSVTYRAYRAPPQTSFAPADSHTIFYQSRAVQSLLPPSGTQTLRLAPRALSRDLYVLVSGSGSPDDAFPFAAGSAQIPVGLLPTADYPESRLDCPADVSLVGFNVNTGFLKLPAYVPYMPDPSQVTLYRDAPDVVTDADGRNFWPKSDSGSPAVYSPVAFAQQLASGQRHKVALPVLMELKDDFPSIGRRGTTVLAVITAWSEYDPENGVALAPAIGASAAAVYRIRGGLMGARRPDY